MSSKDKIIEYLFEDIGPTAIVCFIFGILIFIFCDTEQIGYLTLGLISLVYFISRVKDVGDREKIIEEIKKNGDRKWISKVI